MRCDFEYGWNTEQISTCKHNPILRNYFSDAYQELQQTYKTESFATIVRQLYKLIIVVHLRCLMEFCYASALILKFDFCFLKKHFWKYTILINSCPASFNTTIFLSIETDYKVSKVHTCSLARHCVFTKLLKSFLFLFQ